MGVNGKPILFLRLFIIIFPSFESLLLDGLYVGLSAL
jgi:hypothetical protein